MKLLDFGIAKLQIAAVSEPTVPFNRMMTPGHASPEQLSGEPMSRASDIYSLGLILYQLLTGTLPFADPLAKLRSDPPPPSRGIREDLSRTPETTDQLRRRVVGDLDNIVLMCLRRDPRQRYDSARELADDLQRFLEGRAVKARPGHFTERVVKFVKRNRVAAAVCALVLLLLVFGTWQTVRAQIETRRVQAGESEIAGLLDELNQSKGQGSHAQDLRKLRQTLQRDLPTGSTANPERGDLFRRSLQYLDALRPLAARDPALAAELADTYRALGGLAGSAYPEIAQAALQGAAETLAASAGGGDTEPAPTYSGRPAPSRARSTAVEAPIPSEWRPLATTDSSASTPTVAEPPHPAADNSVVRELTLRLDNVASEVAAAEDNYNQIRQNSQALGQIPHPDITKNYMNTKSALDRARRELDAGQIEAAREDLESASAYAKRVK